MPEQVTQLLEILDGDGVAVGIALEVGPGGAAGLTARDGEGRAVFLFRPATLQLGADGHAGGLLVRDQAGAPVLDFNAFTAQLRLGTVEHPAEATLTGNLTILDSANRQVLNFSSADAELTIGAQGQPGVLTIRDTLNQAALRFAASGAELSIGDQSNAGELLVRDGEGRLVFFFRSDFAELRIGERGNAGDLIVLDDDSRDVMRLNGAIGTLSVGVRDNGGTLLVRDAHGRDAFSFDSGQDAQDPFSATRAFARIGARETPGRLEIRDGEERPTLQFTSDNARLVIGTRDRLGELQIRDDQERETLRFTSENARLAVGAGGKSGRLVILDVNGEGAVVVDSQAPEPGVALPGSEPTPQTGTARVRIGGARTSGDLQIEDGHGRSALHFNCADAAILRMGARDHEGRLIINDSENREVFSFESDHALLHIGSNGQERIRIDGEAGDIQFMNADVAERFDVADDVNATPGTVMVLSEDQGLQPCATPYDRRVVGVVSGAGCYRPGILLDAGPHTIGQVPISIFGKVSCKADARAAPIAVGDLLTTSSTPGHAMKACGSDRAFGAVLGKALSALDSGAGLVKMLVALQ